MTADVVDDEATSISAGSSSLGEGFLLRVLDSSIESLFREALVRVSLLQDGEGREETGIVKDSVKSSS